ncbi:hypothetical protein [Bradyrhizobium guangdongense]|uniref:hypothetical protein n=1 Tax=Bradyrhizobium guangdongense TaxID=1325090 RepID=UPI001319E580|nr:hypothetical protein [Bradyrhizobium guangdongense]
MIALAAARSSLKKAISSLLLSFTVLLPSSAHPQGFDLDRWNRGFYLAASVKNAVILVRSSRAENMQLLLVEFDSGKLTKFKSKGSHLLSPYLSPDGARLLFSRELLDRKGTELVSCDTSNFTCRVILRSAGSIHSAIQISGGRILYVSSPFVTGGDGRVRLSRNDIWIIEPKTGPRQLTDFRFYELGSLAVAQDQIYFSAYGPSRDRPVIPLPDARADQQSSIFRLPYDPEKAMIDPPSRTLSPLFVSAGIANYPAASVDGSLVAFLRTRTNISSHHYDLVIANPNSKSEQLIEAPGLGASRPIIIDHDVYASVVGEDWTLIQVRRQGEHSMKTLADISDASIARTEAVELNIDQ